MATCTKIFILCYLLLYPHYSFAFDHVTIVNEDTIDKEFDNNIYELTEFVSANIRSYSWLLSLSMNILELFNQMFTHTI